MKKYEFKVNNVPVEVNSYLDESNLQKEDLIDSVLKQTKPNKDIGYGGIENKEYFKKILNFITNPDGEMREKQFKISDKEHVDCVKDALNKCSSVLEDKLYVFTFPVYSKFVSEKMDGSSGFAPYKNVFYINLSPYENKEKQKESIKHTVGHELGHALSEEHKNYSPGRMLKEEGLNEHFREKMIGGGRDPWTKAISKEKVMKIFNEIKGDLDSNRLVSYWELFHGKNGKYPRWSGYTIGYYLIEDYLNDKYKKDKIDWKKLFKTPSKEIIDYVSYKK